MTRRVLFTFSGWLGVSSLLLLPFVYTREAIDPVQLPRFIIVCGVILLLVLAYLASGAGERGIPPGVKLAVLPVAIFSSYIVASSMSLFRSLSIADGAFEILRLVVFGIVLVVALYAFSLRERSVATVAAMLSVAGLFLPVLLKPCSETLPCNLLGHLTPKIEI